MTSTLCPFTFYSLKPFSCILIICTVTTVKNSCHTTNEQVSRGNKDRIKKLIAMDARQEFRVSAMTANVLSFWMHQGFTEPGCSS
ncbi:hypothetical protein KCU91_g78, partial [Aureobasidium melanogenum]